MDLTTLIIGIAIGAAFSPFWMKVWALIKGWVIMMMKQNPPSNKDQNQK